MKKLSLLILALGVGILGCAATTSKDMRLSNQALESINNRNYLEAEKYLNQALAENPNNPYALLNLGVVFQNTNRSAQAQVMYEKVIKLNPTDVAGESNEKTNQGKTLTDLARANLNRLLGTHDSTSGEIGRDGRFIAYNNGTVLDTKTNLVWAAKDSGEDMNWKDAKNYCESYHGGGYRDWRMPNQQELAGLYDAKKSRPAACGPSFAIHVATELIDITCFAPWAAETRGTGAPFDFAYGQRYWDPQTYGYKLYRALPVRSGK